MCIRDRYNDYNDSKTDNGVGDTINESNRSLESFKKLEIAKIKFSYKGSTKNIINNLSLDIKKGMSLGIIGASGSGKSTLIDIILGMLVPKEGQVLVNGNRLQDQRNRWWSKVCLLYTSPSPRDGLLSRMPSSA